MVRVSRMGAAVGAVVLLGSSAASVALLEVRMDRARDLHFAFLAWNLLLAWIPMLLALVVFAAHRLRAPGAILGLGIGLWVLFLPNAPYILTDFIHLQPDSRIPLWFDFLLLGTFASAGLLLGFASVFLVQVVVSERASGAAGWALSMGVFALSAVGIYIGRVLRWNSWDAWQEPGTLVALAMARLADPFGNSLLIETVVLFTAFLALTYVALYGAGKVALRGLRLALARPEGGAPRHLV